MKSLQEILKNHYYQGWYPKWIRNNHWNWQTIYGDFRRGLASVKEIQRVENTPAIIVGSGPSLDDAIPYLGDWEHAIFCGPTNALALEARGIHPNYLHAYDSHHTNAERLKYTWDYSITSLITHPSADPKILKAWKGRRYYFLRMFPEHEYFEYILPMAWSHIYKDRGIDVIFPFRGCVVNNEIAIAGYLGYNPLFLVGADFGWKDPAKTRHTTYTQDGRGGLKVAPMTHEDDMGAEINISPNGTHYVGKDDNFKRHLLDMLGPIPTDVFDCSDGMVTELKKADIREVIERQGKDYHYSLEEKGQMRREILDFLRSKH